MADPTVWTTHSQTGVHPNLFESADALSWILGVPSSDVLFLNEIFGRQALHCRDVREDRFDHILTRADLDRRARARARPRRGGGLVFDALQETHPPLERLCAALARQACRVTYADAHLSPGASTGAVPTSELHDLFVLQVEGSRRWRLYEGERYLPQIRFTLRRKSPAPGPVAAELELTAGDALYIPPGLTHARWSCDGPSLHIEVVVIPFTWAEFLEECLEELIARSDPWRENLPFGFGLQAAADFAPIREEFRRRLAALSFDVDATAILQARVDELK